MHTISIFSRNEKKRKKILCHCTRMRYMTFFFSFFFFNNFKKEDISYLWNNMKNSVHWPLVVDHSYEEQLNDIMAFHFIKYVQTL